jgi:hypothetical protein
MTDDERKKLVAELRSASFYRGPEFAICDDAANEIERLAKEIALLRDEYGILLERTTNMLDMTVR